MKPNTNPEPALTMEESVGQVDTVRALGPIYASLKLQGMYITEEYRLHHKIHATVNFILSNIMYYACFIIELFFVKSLKQLLENLPMNICVTSCNVKFCVILKLRPHLIKINQLLNRLDKRPMTARQSRKLENVIRDCKRITLAIMALYLTLNSMYTLNGAVSNYTRLLYDIWVPYHWEHNHSLFWVYLFMQYAFQIQLSLENVANDFIGALYLNVLNTHLEIIMERFAKLHHDPNASEEESMQKFKEYVEDHRIIME